MSAASCFSYDLFYSPYGIQNNSTLYAHCAFLRMFLCCGCIASLKLTKKAQPMSLDDRWKECRQANGSGAHSPKRSPSLVKFTISARCASDWEWRDFVFRDQIAGAGNASSSLPSPLLSAMRCSKTTSTGTGVRNPIISARSTHFFGCIVHHHCISWVCVRLYAHSFSHSHFLSLSLTKSLEKDGEQCWAASRFDANHRERCGTR